MDEQERQMWLCDLTDQQLRALASQNDIGGWNTLPVTKLIFILSMIPDVEKPQPTSFSVSGTKSSRSKS